MGGKGIAFVLAIAAALMLAACGSESAQKVSDSQLAFTFEVPKDFKKAELKPGSFQGPRPLVAYGVDRLNLIDVRLSAAREVPLDAVDTQVKRVLSQRGSAGLQSTREKHAGVDMVAFNEVDNTVSDKKAKSKLYFFNGGGRVWELECQFTEDKAKTIEEACTKAVDSVEFK